MGFFFYFIRISPLSRNRDAEVILNSYALGNTIIIPTTGILRRPVTRMCRKFYKTYLHMYIIYLYTYKHYAPRGDTIRSNRAYVLHALYTLCSIAPRSAPPSRTVVPNLFYFRPPL